MEQPDFNFMVCDECGELYNYVPSIEIDYDEHGNWIKRLRICGECH